MSLNTPRITVLLVSRLNMRCLTWYLNICEKFKFFSSKKQSKIFLFTLYYYTLGSKANLKSVLTALSIILKHSILFSELFQKINFSTKNSKSCISIFPILHENALRIVFPNLLLSKKDAIVLKATKEIKLFSESSTLPFLCAITRFLY